MLRPDPSRLGTLEGYVGVMPVRIGAGLSILPDPRGGAEEAAAEAARALDGRGCDLAVVFVSGRHLAVPEAVLEAIADVLSPAALIGCGAQGVLGGGTEVEHGTAVSVWAADLGSGSAEPFQAVVSETEGTTMAGLPPTAAQALLAAFRTEMARAVESVVGDAVSQLEGE